MEIVLKDGTVLQAADDADPAAVTRAFHIQQLKAAKPEEYDPESEAYQQKNAPVKYIDAPIHMRGAGTGAAEGGGVRSQRMVDPTIENERAAVGSGMLRGWKGLTNLALPDSLTPEWASDENIQEMDKRDSHLPLSGKLIGNAASTAPLSGGISSALGAGSRAAGAGSALGRTLASPWARTAVEGGTQGAIFADPDEQGEGAAGGAVLGTVLRGLGKGGGRILRGLVEKSEAAKGLEQLAAQHGEEIFTPLSQAASDEGLISPLAKGFYKEALPIVPSVKGQIEKQSAQAADKLRGIAARESAPTGTPVPGDAGKRPLETARYLKDQFDEAYDQTVKSYAFNVPKNIEADVAAKIKALADPKTTVNKTTVDKIGAEVAALIKQLSSGKSSIDGQNLLSVKRELSDLAKQARGFEKPHYLAADKWIDEIIETELKQGGSKQNLADLARYQELTPAYRAYIPFGKSAEANADKEGRFLFRTLANKAKNSPEQQHLGQLGAATLDKPATSSSLVGKILGGAATGGAGIGAFMAPLATASVIGGGRALASKSVQKALMGDTKIQKMIAEILRKNPTLARRVGQFGKNAAVQTAVGE